jgi:opacity protein-like surface antigen
MKFSVKRTLLAFCIALGACTFPSVANAQTGEKTLGFAGGYSSYNNGGYANLYFQYTFAPHLRIAPEIGYMFRNEGKSGFECSVDMQFPFRLARGFNIYPLAGVTLNNWTYEHDGHATRAGFDFGAGFDIYLTSQLKLTLQGKYSLMNDTGGCFLDMGIGYVF